MAKLLDGSLVVAALKKKQREAVSKLELEGLVPTIGIIRVGKKKDDISYEKSVVKQAASVGVAVKKIVLPDKTTQEQLLTIIKQMNEDSSIHGVLLFRPLPNHIADEIIRNALEPKKDVDGIGDGSLAGVFTGGKTGFPPCTAQACMEILDYYDIDLAGKKVVIIGRSLVVGKPAAMMAIAKNATVTICHTKTVDMQSICRNADILIAAAGKAGIIDKNFLSKGQVVIDVGIHVDESGKLCGDVNYIDAGPIVDALTPVPGGVGAVTTSVLVGNTITAARKSLELFIVCQA